MPKRMTIPWRNGRQNAIPSYHNSLLAARQLTNVNVLAEHPSLEPA